MELAAKLQIKPGQSVAVVDAPADVTLDVPASTASAPDAAEAVVVFVRDRAGLAAPGVEAVLAAARADRLAWIAYPKAGQLGTDLNRDTLWAALQGRDVRPVRQVSIDAVWSALRFRPE